ncbi:DUF3086 domain-containing protein [Pleurocapsa sp. PCC 7319]|uniref:DUF3086 domain-containing protein n=1 Tax=Pleurocapsa sp. PCC 7319 TaxID=118161 RepID=UPI0003483398|nr:DUF3086 domain-containing protein [Pleurocapsa sp. PCC 7319]
MNSEVPPIPESENTNIESIESAEPQKLDDLEIDSTSEIITDVWSEQEVVEPDATPNTQPLEEIQEVEVELDESVNSSANVTLVPEIPEFLESSPRETILESNIATESEEKYSPEESASETELFVDRWLDESESELPLSDSPQTENQTTAEDDEINHLEQQKSNLQREIETLKAEKEQMLLLQVKEFQDSLGRMVEEGTRELKERKTALQIEIEKLERRKDRINQEMRSSFAGSSQELAIRVQGFKDYLVGSLQDLVTAAEKLELAKVEASNPRTREREKIRSRENPRREERNRGRRRERDERGRARNESPQAQAQAQFSEPTFADQSRRIRQLLDKYRNSPDYYGSPWQLRRTFEPVHAKKVQEWFFTQGGRGAVDSMGSRLQNILVASAVISILHNLYGDRCRVLVLTDTPENLGEWRRGLQDCLGISRSNFGSNRGVVLFDSPDILVQRAERLIKDKLLPMIVIDETEELLNLAVLKFPLWLTFAPIGKSTSSNYLY